MKTVKLALTLMILIMLTTRVAAQQWKVMITGTLKGKVISTTADIGSLILDGKTYVNPNDLAAALGDRATVDSEARLIVVQFAENVIDLSAFPTVGQKAELGERYEAPGRNRSYTFSFLGYEFHPSSCMEFPDGTRISLCSGDEEPIPMMLVRYRLGNLSSKDLNINNTNARFTVRDSSGIMYQELGYQREAKTWLKVSKLFPGQELEFIKVVRASDNPPPVDVFVELLGRDERLRYELNGRTDDPVSGDYRITITGFEVVNPTSDDPLNLDGCGDEVYVNSIIWYLKDKNFISGKNLRTATIGDQNGFPNRIKGGSGNVTACPSLSPPNGGLLAGNKFPQPDPRKVQSQPTTNNLPLLLHQGPINEGEQIVVVPAIWEWSGDESLYGEVAKAMPNYLESGIMLSRLIGRLPNDEKAVDGSVWLSEMLKKSDWGWSIRGSATYYAGDPDRPIGTKGMTGGGGSASFHYNPKVLFFNQESVKMALEKGGLITIDYSIKDQNSPDGYDERYRLFIRVEQFK